MKTDSWSKFHVK